MAGGKLLDSGRAMDIEAIVATTSIVKPASSPNSQRSDGHRGEQTPNHPHKSGQASVRYFRWKALR